MKLFGYEKGCSYHSYHVQVASFFLKNLESYFLIWEKYPRDRKQLISNEMAENL